MRALLAVVAALALAACKTPAGSARPAGASKGWDVFKDGKAVAWIDDKPGALSSRAIPPPGAPPVTHPFITAVSKDPMSEGDLRKLLEESTSFQDYVERLRRNGYEVKPAKGGEED